MSSLVNKYENIVLSSGKNPDHNKIVWFKMLVKKKLKNGYKIKGDLVIRDGEYFQELFKVKK